VVRSLSHASNPGPSCAARGTSPGSLTSIVRPAAAWGMPHASLRGGEKKEERKREEGAKSDNTELGAGSRFVLAG
jgi:hypothetical protein